MMPDAASAIVRFVASLDAQDLASIDGSGHNEANPDWGSTGEQLLRLATVEYGDGISSPAGEDRTSAREISNAVIAQAESTLNDRYLTDFIWLWGQFIDHDIDLTEGADPAESLPILVATGDPYFDPFSTGDQTIALSRSMYDTTTGTDESNPRQQINAITAFIDGSVIYGSDEDRAAALRTFEGGLLATSEGDLLPFNDAGLANAGGTSASLFLAGDVRANENVALTSMHTVWVREHNYWASRIASSDATLSDEAIYSQARSIVTAELQAITFNEFLPALLGTDAISPYEGYDETVNPGIMNVFSTALYRLGHSLLSSELQRIEADGSVIDAGNLPLASAFFSPQEIQANGIDALLRGAASQVAQELDAQIVDDVRNFLFGPPGAGGFDLASLNIQRGRDHGLADYNQVRVDLGLSPITSFADITSDVDVQAALASVYDSIDEIDVWVGALAEDHVAGASVGELLMAGLTDQFERLRDGDRLWYENVFTGPALQALQRTNLADVIERNTEIDIAQRNVFYSADVMYVHADGDRPMDVMVKMNRRDVMVLDTHTRHVIASQPRHQVQQIMLVGNMRPAGDHFTLDMDGMNGTLPGGVVINGAAGPDVLSIMGSSQRDRIHIDGNTATINGTAINFSRVRLVEVNTGRGPDDVTFGARPSAAVSVDGRDPFGLTALRSSLGRFHLRAPLDAGVDWAGVGPRRLVDLS